VVDIAAWTLIGVVVALLVLHRRWLAAIWFRSEDPRTVALFRIGVGGLLLTHLISLAPIYEYLYAGEGLVTGEQAGAMFGKQRWSPLYAHDSLEFVRAYRGLQWIACAAFMIGLATPVTKWLTWALFMAMLARNSIDVGGDQVFACFLVLLCLSRCGESYSVDAWLRRRRHPEIPAHRPIPAWPRNLMLLQLVPMYFANGSSKSGAMWREGEMFYYILNYPTWTPWSTWEVSALFGTNLFRVMTWFIHAFELLFPLAVIGWFRERSRGFELPSSPAWARALSHGLFVAIGLLVLVLADATWGGEPGLARTFCRIAGLLLCVWPLTLALVPRLPEPMLRWIFDPRPWAAIMVSFGVMLLLVIQVGRWTGVTVCCALLLFEGEQLGRVLASITRRRVHPSVTVTIEAGRARRVLAVLLSSVHVLAITAVVLPQGEPVAAWRKALEQPMYRWVALTTYSQHWKMFAKVDARWRASDLVVELRGPAETSVIGDGILESGDERSIDRRWKARKRLLGTERYRKLHARWVCRRFTLPSGRSPITVVISRERLRLPAPDELARVGVGRALADMENSRTREVLLVHTCASQ